MFKINQVFIKLFFLFALLFFIFSATTYFLLKPISTELAVIDAYNGVWINLGLVSVFILFILYYIIKNISNKLSQDVEEFQNYLEEVSNKNYQAVVKIKYFHDFLEMSLRLKNIIKRLNNKQTKKK